MGRYRHAPCLGLLEHQDGIKWIHTPYKGNADALTALMGGHNDQTYSSRIMSEPGS
jgi:tripartite-type tricarboxylate transporter receptor subunit TctC